VYFYNIMINYIFKHFCAKAAVSGWAQGTKQALHFTCGGVVLWLVHTKSLAGPAHPHKHPRNRFETVDSMNFYYLAWLLIFMNFVVRKRCLMGECKPPNRYHFRRAGALRCVWCMRRFLRCLRNHKILFETVSKPPNR
jgi:hypothetical protein